MFSLKLKWIVERVLVTCRSVTLLAVEQENEIRLVTRALYVWRSCGLWSLGPVYNSRNIIVHFFNFKIQAALFYILDENWPTLLYTRVKNVLSLFMQHIENTKTHIYTFKLHYRFFVFSGRFRYIDILNQIPWGQSFPVVQNSANEPPPPKRKTHEVRNIFN